MSLSFEAFFVALALGSVAIIAGVVIWAVQRVVAMGDLKTKIADVENHTREGLNGLAARVTACEATHSTTNGALAKMQIDIAVLKERSATQVEVMQRIEAAIAGRARRPTKETGE